MSEINHINNIEGRRISVLLAEDRRLVREAWGFILKKENRFQVIAECGSPESALLQARSLLPDIIILEIKPPDLSGIETVSLVRKFSPHSKILGVSLYTFHSVAQEVMQAGASGYLTKTSPLEEMLLAVAEIAEGKTYLCREVRRSPRSICNHLDDGKDLFCQLTIREIEVAVGIRNGLPAWQIADQLNIAGLTVDLHRNRILKKLNLDEDSELVPFLNKHQCLC